MKMSKYNTACNVMCNSVYAQLPNLLAAKNSLAVFMDIFSKKRHPLQKTDFSFLWHKITINC